MTQQSKAGLAKKDKAGMAVMVAFGWIVCLVCHDGPFILIALMTS